MERRRFLAAAGAFALAGCASPTESTRTSTSTGGRTTGSDGTAGTTNAGPANVTAETLASGMTAPLGVVRDGDTYLVADQVGVVHRVTADGLAGTALDLRDRIVSLSGYTEQGLLGIALHPDGEELFVRYSAPPRAGTPSGYSHTFVLAAFARDGDGFDPASERTILEIPEPQSNHNGGDLAFGPDDLLYVGVGDGGGSGDTGTGHVSDWYAGNGGGNGQDVEANLLGSVLRVDVDGREAGKAYAIPDDNPLVGEPGLDEHYAWGFRNPWRFSFDVDPSHGSASGTTSRPGEDFYVADVGESRWEEVDRVERGGNYGWNVREGAHCFRAEECPTETPAGEPLRDPVVEYPHSGGEVSGIAVVGGYVYRGDRIPGWRGEYVFADWRADGRVFVASPQQEGTWPVRATSVDGLASHVLGFGRDANGEVLACTSERATPSGSTGELVRLVAE